ncbi:MULTISPECIES: hypothetical protein [Photorhabdus]|uniref:EthD domain-containing protein n=2 Tax=Photorhabdus asymbiotica TaxID=291112 RepID=B6VL81_PHOAA|nr:hypothetical protein [Photorhabdus asymbiotica]RKS59710.1 hypothetical protein BDD30_1795 [Photorhabdus asymbiotica]CAQ85855.1 conserved hypothetical Protein [Photorhabdus asymbiotica]CAR66911.1 Hypothetical Protein PA-RVA7-0613 [Photorhabdus asymbiotica subsp. asymbiotica ATCC 43949]
MSAKYIIITRFPLKEHTDINNFNTLKNKNNKKYFISDEPGINELLELRSFSSIDKISESEKELESAFQSFSSILKGDIRRELLKFVEAPIDSEDELPVTEYIQLRHVEVPAENYKEYRQWREETIFNVVRENKEKITSFEAYHSLISGQPGVMFISAFNVDKESYLEVFTNERYLNIIQQAGDNYITGGNGGLYTRIYRSIS